MRNKIEPYQRVRGVFYGQPFTGTVDQVLRLDTDPPVFDFWIIVDSPVVIKDARCKEIRVQAYENGRALFVDWLEALNDEVPAVSKLISAVLRMSARLERYGREDPRAWECFDAALKVATELAIKGDEEGRRAS
jgi:hypothetical protein